MKYIYMKRAFLADAEVFLSYEFEATRNSDSGTVDSGLYHSDFRTLIVFR
jgi:hypothetical protein